MTFPKYSDKHQFDALVSAKQLFEYQKSIGRVPEGECPKRVIVCYQDTIMKKVIESHPGGFSTGVYRKVYWLEQNPGIAIANYGIGAPRAALSLEMLIAWGVKDFISIGTAGAIAPDLKVGDLVGCDSAIRDEGTSHHYLPAGHYSYPTDGNRFAQKFSRRGMTWTIDAFFRNTREEIAHYQKEGVLTVEMEASALFAVAQVRGVKMGAGFVISDLLHGEEWDPQFRQDPVERGLEQLLTLALE